MWGCIACSGLCAPQRNSKRGTRSSTLTISPLWGDATLNRSVPNLAHKVILLLLSVVRRSVENFLFGRGSNMGISYIWLVLRVTQCIAIPFMLWFYVRNVQHDRIGWKAEYTIKYYVMLTLYAVHIFNAILTVQGSSFLSVMKNSGRPWYTEYLPTLLFGLLGKTVILYITWSRWIFPYYFTRTANIASVASHELHVEMKMFWFWFVFI